MFWYTAERSNSHVCLCARSMEVTAVLAPTDWICMIAKFIQKANTQRYGVVMVSKPWCNFFILSKAKQM